MNDPNANRLPIIGSDPIIDFYLGKAPDGAGRCIEEIWKFGHERLERVHDYIQWLFPLPDKSPFNRDAPVLTPKTIRAFRERLAPSATGTIGGGDAGLLWITGDANRRRQPNNRERRYLREQSRGMVRTGKSQSPAFVSHPSQYKDSWFGSFFASAFYLSKRDLPGPQR